MSDLVNISIGNAVLTAVMGYAVVFFGLVLLMIVIMVMGKVMAARTSAVSAQEAAVSTAVEAVPEAKKAAPGSAGQLKLYDTDPRDAAMIMAIVADSLGRPINELRFISIREVK